MYDAKNIAFHDIAINEGKGWFYNIGYNAIFKIDLETGKLKLEAFVPQNTITRELYKAITYYNEKLYLAPWKDNRLCVYDLRKKEFCFIDLDLEKYGEEQNYNLLCQVEVISDNIYFFPGRFHAIVKLNPRDNSLEYIDFWYGELSARWGEDKRSIVIFNKTHVKDNDWCILPCWRANVILKINVSSGEFAIIESGFDGEFSDVVAVGEKYIGVYKSSTSLYEVCGKGIVKMPLETEEDGGCLLEQYGSDICVIPLYGKRVDIYDLDTYEKKSSYEFPDMSCDAQKWLLYKSMSLCNKKIDDHRLVLYSNRSGKIIIIDMAKYSVRSLVPTMDVETEKIIKEHLSELFRKIFFQENSNYGLKDFLETLSAVL